MRTFSTVLANFEMINNLDTSGKIFLMWISGDHSGPSINKLIIGNSQIIMDLRTN